MRALAFGPPALPASTPARARQWRFAILVLAGAPRIWAALFDRGILIPEEVLDTLEPAHHFAFGWGLVPQDFRDGVRSWFFPGLLGLLWKLAAALGVHTGLGLIGIAKLGMAGLSIASVWLAMNLALRLGGQRAAILTGLLAVACPPLIAHGSRAFTDTATVPCIVGAALLLETRGPRHAAMAGALATLTMFLSYPNGFLALGFLMLLLARHRRMDAKAYLYAGLVVLLLGGLLDWPTWGWPFRSLASDLRLHVLDHNGWIAHRSPFPRYFELLETSMGVSSGIMALGLVLALRRVRGLVMFVVLAVLGASLIPEKELRLILPLLPLALALAAVGLVRLMDGLEAGATPTYALGVLCAGQMALIARAPTKSQLGLGPADVLVWHTGDDYFRTIDEAAKALDLCGIVYTANDAAWTGGYSALHRPVPIFFDTHPEHLASANYVVGSPLERLPPGWTRAVVIGRYALWRRPGDCNPPPADWNMNLP